MKKLILVVAALIFCFGCASDKEKNVIVKFKGGSIVKEDLVAHYNRLKRKSRYRKHPEQLTPEVVFNHALNMEMVIAKGIEEKLHLDPRIRQEIHGLMSSLFLKVMQDKLVPKIDKESITEEEMRQFYEDHKGSYKKKALYSVGVIKVGDQEKAELVVSEIKMGKITFEDAAGEYLSGKISGKAGGIIIGAREIIRFPKDWRTAIERLKLGEISCPVKIEDDYCIFKLVRKTESYQYTYEQKKPYIRNDVLYGRYAREWQKTYDRLKEKFNVKVDEDRLREFYEEFKRGKS